MARIVLSVNGTQHTVDADDAMPLLWLLRDTLGLTGTKYGCGVGLCGACTIHIDGVAIRSCVTPVSAAQGSSITTIEGLSPDGQHPVQAAWIAYDVPQCGYCQSGHIMKAAELLQNNKKPTAQDIDQAFSNMICRCGTHVRIKRALLALAGPA